MGEENALLKILKQRLILRYIILKKLLQLFGLAVGSYLPKLRRGSIMNKYYRDLYLALGDQEKKLASVAALRKMIDGSTASGISTKSPRI